MKKLISIILCLVLIAAIGVACSKGGTEEPTTEINNSGIVGGWQRADSPEITDEFKAVFEKAAAEMTGVEYTPVAYIASQIVAGTNHRVLCTAKAVTPNAAGTYAIVTVYEDLQGGAEITDVMNSSVPAAYTDEAVDGGWGEAASPAVTDEAKAALDKASEALAGATHNPIALLETQIVAGTNYMLLCESTPTVPDAETYYSIVTVYADLEGNAQITDTFEFTAE